MPTVAEINMRLGDTFDNIRADMRDLAEQIIRLKKENEDLKKENSEFKSAQNKQVKNKGGKK